MEDNDRKMLIEEYRSRIQGALQDLYRLANDAGIEFIVTARVPRRELTMTATITSGLSWKEV